MKRKEIWTGFIQKKMSSTQSEEINSCIYIYIYIYLLNLVTSPILLLIVFFSFFFNPPPSGSSFSFILSSFFHLHPPRVDKVAGFDPCPINTFLNSLGVVVRLKITVQVSLPH